MSLPAPLRPCEPGELFDLLDWKRQIFDLYRRIRDDVEPANAWRAWRDLRDELIATHPQSPLDPQRREAFTGLSYFD